MPKEKKSKKRITIILSVLTGVLILSWIGLSCYMGMQVFDGSTQLVTPEGTSVVSDAFWEKYGMDYDAFCEKYTIEKINIPSTFDGHMIPADFIYNGEIGPDTVVMAHGLGGNRYSNYPVAQLFLENGYNVITYDQRSTNENIAERTTFGYWEKYDLLDYIAYAKEHTPCRKIGVWGTSFGGATAVQAVAYEDAQKDLSFLILDCPVSSMKWMVEDEIKGMGIPIPSSYVTWCGNVTNQLKLGFSYEDADAGEQAKRITIPALVINSKADQVTPYFMGETIYKNIQSDKKELWTSPDSEHANLWLDYNEEYRLRVAKLLAEAD